MERLPYIDQHAAPVAAAPERTWEALLAVLPRAFGGPRTTAVARILGCEPAAVSGPAFGGRVGETLAGFRVAEAEPGRRLALRGRHRFADYELAFVVEDGRVLAVTRAAFPGPHGRLYRLAVIGTRAHRVVTRRLLRGVAQRAQRRADAGAPAGAARPAGG